MRFPEFTEPWETAKLGEVVEFCNERISTSELSIDNYVSTENLLQDFQGVLPANSIPADTNVISYKEGDILISNIRPYLRKVWKADNRGGCSTDVFVLRTKKSNCNSSFINYQIANDRFITYVMSGAKGVKMPRGDKKQMEKYPLSYPSFEEQDKIAHLLALLEQRIALQSGLIEDLKNIKKYLMEQLFCQPKEKSPRLRLGGMSGEWKRVRLCDVVERVSTRNKTNECTRVLTIAAQYGLIDQQEFFNKQIASSDLTTYYLLHRGDFAYNKSYSSDYPWGAVKRLDNYDEGVLSSLYICFCPNHSIDSDFLRHYFESTKWYRGISEISGEGARNHGLLNMSVDDYFNTMHRFPSIEEQTCISHVLNTFDRKVLIEESILEKLRRQKSYLLNNMFI